MIEIQILIMLLHLLTKYCDGNTNIDHTLATVENNAAAFFKCKHAVPNWQRLLFYIVITKTYVTTHWNPDSIADDLWPEKELKLK